ncbi:hypothetical protein [Pseudorhodoferax sp. Leaf274]|uniref:hypothetical protein n=1 Tax=Pseudorhodoferax sp. Leaf274 TaxID=1736318 RepID=UPI000702ADE6|nr:hypothetical protein [Pseudorhodoferax sp. Leaf274]KQP48636.1 hypothetical protein ASF44_22310 [Pseudorhodoferax sp. Leaf274]
MALSAAAQPAPASFHMVQRIDEMLVGVDAIALDVVDRHHVAGTYFLVHALRPSPLVGYANYVIDCRVPQRIAILSSVMPSGRLEPEQPFVQPPRRSGRIDPSSLAFEPTHVMDGTAFVASFSCDASGAPGRAAQIAAELAARGSPPDSRSLYCQMRPDAGQAARRAEVRYSAAENAVAVNGQWLSSGFVAGDEVVFGTGAQWRVDTRKRQARLLRDDGRQLFQGECQTSPERP